MSPCLILNIFVMNTLQTKSLIFPQLNEISYSIVGKIRNFIGHIFARNFIKLDLLHFLTVLNPSNIKLNLLVSNNIIYKLSYFII